MLSALLAFDRNTNPKATISLVRNSVNRSPFPRRCFSEGGSLLTILRWRLGFLLTLALALACFALSPAAQAVSPAPDGGYPNSNTAEGDFALNSLTYGVFNTAIGADALYHNTTGGYNTATGVAALVSNTTGGYNTANGVDALYSNTYGGYNTANGYQALYLNTTGYENTANGYFALQHNTTGYFNTANGDSALYHNTTGVSNTANGDSALFSNTTGTQNTANGVVALYINTTGSNNTANGGSALQINTTGTNNTAEGFRALGSNTTGSNNIGLGYNAGSSLTTGSNNIDIGNLGVAGEAATIRIGSGAQTRTFIAGIRGKTTVNVNAIPVLIDSAGQLGTTSSSRRFKKEIKPMDQTSEAILALKPVTFHYKSDSTGTPQFGLIAEEVAKVNPDLVVRDENGEIYTVRYDAINAMLLNEFLKEHRKMQEQDHKVQEQEATIAELKSTVAKQEKDSQATAAQQQKEFESKIAQQQKGMEVLTATLKEQASQIQKVSAQLEASRPAPQMVNNHQ